MTQGKPAQRSPSPGRGPGMTGTELVMTAVLSLLGAALFVSPVLRGLHLWGVCDWDQHLLYYGFPRWSIIQRGEWPFWNPYACGGNPALANPQSPFLNPAFLVVLPLGVLPGIKLLIWIHAALSIFGAYLLGRRLGGGHVGSWVPAAAYGLSSAYALHLSAGHATWIAMAYLPFALVALHASFDRPLWAPTAGAAAALCLLAGHAYFFVFVLFFAAAWSVLEAASRRSQRPLVAAVLMIAAAGGISAVKLLPMAHFMAGVATFEVPDRSTGDPWLLAYALMGRSQHLRSYEAALSSLPYRWWEYGAYVGPVVLLLGLGYGFLRIRRAWPLMILLAGTFALTLGRGWGAWDAIRLVPALQPPAKIDLSPESDVMGHSAGRTGAALKRC